MLCIDFYFQTTDIVDWRYIYDYYDSLPKQDIFDRILQRLIGMSKLLTRSGPQRVQELVGRTPAMLLELWDKFIGLQRKIYQSPKIDTPVQYNS